MAGIQEMCCTGKIAAVGSGGAAAPQTLLQAVAPTNQRFKVLGYDISFDGATSTAVPVLLVIQRQTTAGTFTNATNVPKLIEKELTETPQVNFQTVATVEPTNGDVLYSKEIPAYMGYYEILFPFGQEIYVQGGGRIGFTVTAPAAVNVTLNVRIEE